MKKFKCPLCDFEHGRSKAFQVHLQSHGYETIKDAYIAIFLNGVHPVCACNLCGKETVFVSWNSGFTKFINGHNANLKSSYSEEEANLISEKRKNSLRGKVGWSAGLSKENDERLAKAAKARSVTVKKQFDNGRIQWSKGLTKETDERLAVAAKCAHEKFVSGERVSWQTGLTKENSVGLRKMSESLKITFNEPKRRNRLDKLKQLNNVEILRRIREYATNFEMITDISEYKHYKEDNLMFLCKRCNRQELYSLISICANRCKSCDPAGSLPQIEISKYINSLGFETDLCNKEIISPYEIDIDVIGKNFCIEFNGLYFHSELFKHPDHHAMKSRLCEENGKRLFHVFSDEWEHKKDIVKSMIAHKLGISEHKIGARECSIITLSSKDKRKFFDENHIDGDVNSKIAFGLVDKSGLIVAAISLRKPFHKKYTGQLEVGRFCTSKFYTVHGALSRLTKRAVAYAKENEFSSIMTYVDSRHGVTTNYLKSGYSIIGKTSNRFWWTDTRIRIDRFKVRADKKNKLSEREVANQLGVTKIWGCPSFTLTIST